MKPLLSCHWLTLNFYLLFQSLAVTELKMPVPDLQKAAPIFKGTAVVDGQFKEISLEDYKGKYVILFFYPLDL